MGFIEMKILHYTVPSIPCLSTWELKVFVAAQSWSSSLQKQCTLPISCETFDSFILFLLLDKTFTDFPTAKVFLGAPMKIY